jgi:CubicO group peptidase (beta-lactamase class C family)
LLIAVAAYAQDAAARLEALFTSPGTPYLNGGVLVAENGRIVYQGAFGLADVAAGTPNRTDSRFQTASLTKVFTSTAVLQLMEQRRLRLDDPVVRYLHEFPFPQVTIRQLLAHTSGLPDLELYEPLVAREPNRVIRNADALLALKEWTAGLAFAPGSQFRYSNTNYVLLALVIEKVSRMPYSQYLARRVFAPAGMTDTYVRTPDTPPDPRLVKNHVLPTMYTTSATRPATSARRSATRTSSPRPVTSSASAARSIRASCCGRRPGDWPRRLRGSPTARCTRTMPRPTARNARTAWAGMSAMIRRSER